MAIYVDSWNEGFGALMPTIDADSGRIDRWRNALADPSPQHWWVAERAGSIRGFVGVGPSRDPVGSGLGELDTIAVCPASWRGGVGRALMAVALEQLRSDGYELALLWTLDAYPRGAKFYRAMGWRLNGATRMEGRQVRYDHDL